MLRSSRISFHALRDSMELDKGWYKEFVRRAGPLVKVPNLDDKEALKVSRKVR